MTNELELNIEETTGESPDVTIDNGGENKYISVSEAADYSGLSKQRIYALITNNFVKTIDNPNPEHRGAQVLVVKDTLDTYLANRDKPRGERKQKTIRPPSNREVVKKVDKESYLALLNVPLGELVAAYIQMREYRPTYTVLEAQRETGAKREVIELLCKMKLIDCSMDEDRIMLSQQGLKQLEEIKDRYQ